MNFGSLTKKAKGLIKGNSEKIKDGVEKAADFANSKLDDKHNSKIDKVKDTISDSVEKLDSDVKRSK